VSIKAERAIQKRAKAFSKLPMMPVEWQPYSEIIWASEPWDPIRWPDNHDWYLIKDVPLSYFKEITAAEIEDVEDPEERLEHMERYKTIKGMLKNGAEPWPVIVGDHGGVIDGYHRLAAMQDLKRKTVDVLYVYV
jgi:hypothetical protein